jgi:hypothetical protein
MEVAAALGVRVRDLRDDLDAMAPGHEVLPQLRRSLIGRPPQTEPRPAPAIAADVLAVGQRLVTSSRPFAEQGPAVPPLVAELRAATGNAAEGPPEALRALVLAALLAARIASELRHPDLAWIAADLGMRAAERVGDERYAAAVACRLARGAQREGDIEDAWRTATEHAEPLRTLLDRDPGDHLAGRLSQERRLFACHRNQGRQHDCAHGGIPSQGAAAERRGSGQHIDHVAQGRWELASRSRTSQP